jgi:hypothetical protein
MTEHKKMSSQYDGSARGIIYLRRMGLLLAEEPSSSDGKWWIHRGHMYISWGGSRTQLYR